MSSSASRAQSTHVTLEEPDVIYWHLVGDVSADDIRAIYAIQMEFCGGKPYALVLIDLSRMRSITPEARRAAAEGPTPGKQVMPIRASAVIGASFHFRIIGTLVSKAAHFINRTLDSPSKFFDNENEARAWFDERRLEIGTSSLRQEPTIHQ